MAAEDNSRVRWKCYALGFLGLLATAIVIVLIAYVYLFASMVDPALSQAEQWQLIATKMFLTAAVIPTSYGIVLILGGMGAAVLFLAESFGLTTSRLSNRGLQRAITFLAWLVGVGAMLLIAF
jgi:hypothetical protein